MCGTAPFLFIIITWIDVVIKDPETNYVFKYNRIHALWVFLICSL